MESKLPWARNVQSVQALGAAPEKKVLRQLLDRIHELPMARGQCAIGKMPTWDGRPTWVTKIVFQPNLGLLTQHAAKPTY